MTYIEGGGYWGRLLTMTYIEVGGVIGVGYYD